MEHPIIVKIESQKNIGYEFWSGGRSVSLTENVGFDKEGKRWKWTTYTVWTMDNTGLYSGSTRDKGDFRRIADESEVTK